MDEPRWQLVAERFHDALEQPPMQREAWLAHACGDDHELADEVRSLLAAHGAAEQAAATPRPAETTIPGYRLLSRLGEGGFGTVHLAEQLRPVHRLVAVKVLRLGLDSDQVVARFAREREALARMRHPGIAQVYDAGTTDHGAPFFAMEYVEGATLTEYCRRHGLDLAQRLRLFVQVCHGVHHAHQKGVIHRDLKPSNVLVTTVDGVPVPKIIDFGIAKALRVAGEGVDELRTLAGSCFGTPGYMSPEQLEQDGGGDVRSDVYSLGVMLFELLTERLPHDPAEHLDRGLLAFLQRVRDVEPPRPSAVVATTRRPAGREAAAATSAGTPSATTATRRQLRFDLDWITLRALERDPARRYQSADDLASDLERYLRLEPVSAGPPHLSYRLRKFVRRHRVAAASGIAVGTALVVGLLVALWQNGVARAALVASTGHRLSAQALNLVEENPPLALLLAIEGAQRAPGEDANAALYRTLAGNHLLGETLLHDGAPYWIARSGDGTRVVTADDSGLIVGTTTATGDVVRRFDLGERSFAALLLDHAGGRCTAIDADGAVFDLDLGTGAIDGTHVVASPARCGALAADGSLLLAGNDGRLRRRQRDGTTTVVADFAALGIGEASALCLAADGRHVAVLGADERLVEFDLVAGTERRFVPTNTSAAATPLAVATDGDATPVAGSVVYGQGDHWLVAHFASGTVHAFHRSDAARSFCVETAPVVATALATRRDVVAIGRRDGASFVVDLATRQRVAIVQPIDQCHAAHVAIDPAGTTFVQAIKNRPLAHVSDAVTGRFLTSLQGEGHGLYAPVFDDTGTCIVMAGHDGTVHRWRTDSLDERRTLAHALARGERRGLVELPDPECVVATAVDASGHHDELVDTRTGATRQRLATRRAEGRRAYSSPRGDAVLVHDDDGTHLRALADGRVLFTCRFGLDRPRVNAPLRHVVGLHDGALRVYEVASGRLLRTIPDAGAQYVDVDSEGQYVVAAQGGSNRTTVWSIATGEPVRVVEHTAFAFDAGFTADGTAVLTLANDRKALLVDLASGRLRHQWRVPTGDFGYLRMGPVGRYAALWTEQVGLVYDLRDGSQLLRWEPRTEDRRIDGVVFTADESRAVLRLRNASLVQLPMDPLAAALAAAPRAVSPLERARFHLPPATTLEPAAVCARPAIATAFALLADPAVDAAGEQRAMALLQAAALLREHPPGWFFQTRCMARCRRASRNGGQFADDDLAQALADLRRYASSPRAQESFLANSPVLAPLRTQSEFQAVLQALRGR